MMSKIKATAFRPHAVVVIRVAQLHARIQKVLSEGANFDNVLVDDGREDPNTTILARQRNTIKMTFHWRAADGQTSNAGLVAL